MTAVTRLWLGVPAGAAAAASAAAATLASAGELEHAAFWRYVQAQSHSSDDRSGDAIGALRAAVNAATNTAWFSRLRKILAELRDEQARVDADEPWTTWDNWVRTSGPGKLNAAVTPTWHALAGGTHDQQCEALTVLGRMAGVSTDCPAGSSASDVVWTWLQTARVERRLWEVKTGTPVAVPRAWINQTVGQLAAHGASTEIPVTGCLVTSLTDIEDDAAEAARDELTVIHRDALVVGSRRSAGFCGTGHATGRLAAEADRAVARPDRDSRGRRSVPADLTEAPPQDTAARGRRPASAARSWSLPLPETAAPGQGPPQAAA